MRDGNEQQLLSYLFEGSLRFPNVTRAHLHKMFNGSSDADVLPNSFAPVVERMAQVIAAAVPVAPEHALERAVQALSAVLFPGFFGGFFAPCGALTSAEARTAYVQMVTATALCPAQHDVQPR